MFYWPQQTPSTFSTQCLLLRCWEGRSRCMKSSTVKVSHLFRQQQVITDMILVVWFCYITGWQCWLTRCTVTTENKTQHAARHSSHSQPHSRTLIHSGRQRETNTQNLTLCNTGHFFFSTSMLLFWMISHLSFTFVNIHKLFQHLCPSKKILWRWSRTCSWMIFCPRSRTVFGHFLIERRNERFYSCYLT